ncbi:unnamed protein product [Bursaphelenchus okinawaensis]|uniref:Uncharacterized protein n=1 Tax=Bursaphelenchus okinawaensis TaxID=465554 RepID=A0A811LT43_9BILA|nr:unnamed protein product [Bursaphelenchus okinawaensis]CAG9127624.1 unnamed protein product [Bursaphelenchus okinawaensis]
MGFHKILVVVLFVAGLQLSEGLRYTYHGEYDDPFVLMDDHYSYAGLITYPGFDDQFSPGAQVNYQGERKIIVKMWFQRLWLWRESHCAPRLADVNGFFRYMCYDEAWGWPDLEIIHYFDGVCRSKIFDLERAHYDHDLYINIGPDDETVDDEQCSNLIY